MRIRQIKPAFWTDRVMASLPFRARLLYVGLWQLADDGGWLVWDVAQAGAELLPFESARRRERWLGEDMQRLMDAGRVVLHDCGHVQVPTLSEHQKFGGRPVYTAMRAHARDCARLPHTVGNGKVGNGKGVARTDAQLDGFENVKTTVAALGLGKP